MSSAYLHSCHRRTCSSRNTKHTADERNPYLFLLKLLLTRGVLLEIC